jgi:hypothetical protein
MQGPDTEAVIPSAEWAGSGVLAAVRCGNFFEGETVTLY